MTQQPKLSLGPISYYWPKETVEAFYERILDAPVDIVYLGETICSKRTQLCPEDWLAIAERLSAAGKEVVLSTLALLEAESELQRLRRICANGRYLVEANDIGAIHLMQGKPFVAGHSVNVYNERSLALLARQGLKRWVFPVELSHQSLADMQLRRPTGVETEVFAYGRLPLAYSARCFTARAHNLPKDDCRYCCIDYPDGLTLAAQDDTRFLALNGIQTQSAKTFNLVAEIPRLRELDVDVIRISPQSNQTERVIEVFYRCLTGDLAPAEGEALLEPLMPVGPCDGYWHGMAGLQRRTQPVEEVSA